MNIEKELLKVSDEAKSEGLVVNSESLNHAKFFLKNLPDEVMNPEISIDPDGDLNFTWPYPEVPNSRDIFSISFSPTGEMNYAGEYNQHGFTGKESISDIHTQDTIIFNMLILQNYMKRNLND